MTQYSDDFFFNVIKVCRRQSISIFMIMLYVCAYCTVYPYKINEREREREREREALFVCRLSGQQSHII